jgi:desulfoferrodoxin-like iron-binding protein
LKKRLEDGQDVSAVKKQAAKYKLRKNALGDSTMANVKKVGEVYRCEVCGNIVEVRKVGGGELVCCGQPMILEKEGK